jgi:hypothetical protein
VFLALLFKKYFPFIIATNARVNMENPGGYNIIQPGSHAAYSGPHDVTDQSSTAEVAGQYLNTGTTHDSFGHIQNGSSESPFIYICRGCSIIIFRAVFGSNQHFDLVRGKEVCCCCGEIRVPGYLVSRSQPF